MGYIKEPESVDLVIKSRRLTKKEEIAISDYIRDYKAHSRRYQLKRKGRIVAAKPQRQFLTV